MLRILLAFMLLVTLATPTTSAWAASKDRNNEVATKGPRRHLGTIVFSGVAGAILGLSTLSFYGRPQDKLNNIAMGAAFGIIIGATYTTFKAAAEPREFYGRADKDLNLWAINDNPRALAQKPAAAFDLFNLSW